MRLNHDQLKQAGFLLVLSALAILLFWFLNIFLPAFLGAIVFYILLRRPFFYLNRKIKWKWNIYLNSTLLILLSFLVLVLPVLLVSLMLSDRVGYIIHHYEEILQLIVSWANQAQQYWGMNLLSGETVAKLSEIAAKALPGLVSATAGAMADIFILYFLLYFMLINAEKFERIVRDNLPFKDGNDQLLLTELKSQTLSNTIGIPILATLQAFTAWIGYWVIGLPEPFFWGIITGLMSVLPLVGTAVVWIPLTIFLYASGHPVQGIAIGLYGAIVITNIDNVFRFVVQKKLGDVHPLITFFGVLFGLQVFGLVGIIFGPLLISYFILLLKIYRKEYLE
ncbi:MAG: AI-2E family transporter [Bacteroidetes bacterium]|nr:AI-2E family transporter [Bacteroidota bacterium]